MKKTYKDVDSSLLNAIPNPDKKTYEIKIKQPELTFLGVYDQPDFASLYILFYPDKTIVELKSLKMYLQQYRDLIISYDVELFTWEKLDMIDKIKELIK